jgi:putative oxidoreductase
MTIAPSTGTASPIASLAARVQTLFALLDRVPYTLLALPLRLAVATVFWNSAMTHLANWDTTLELFATEYALPIIPPVLAAYLAVAIELVTPPLLIIGLLVRPTALVLLGMTAVIEVFVYPLAWPTHIQWAAMMLVLLCRGAGALSLDQLIARYLFSDR